MLEEISKEFEKIKEKNKTTQTQINSLITNLKSTLQEAQTNLSQAIQSNSPNIQETSKEIIDKTISKVTSMSIDKKYNTIMNGFYGSLSKLGKIMSKDLENDTTDNFHLYPYDKNLFYNIIVKDLYRRGDFKTSDSLIKEANLNFDSDFRSKFKDLNIITRNLKNRNISTLNDWCLKYKALLDNMKSKLPFECVKLQYLLLLSNNDIPLSECVSYSKKNFKPFLENPLYYDEISKLMTHLLFRNNPISKCPYKKINMDDLWNKVSSMFISDCCTILTLPNESGFYLAVVAGMISLPQLLKAEHILKSKKELLNEKELPYELQLPNQLKFHNLFICPVTKDTSTVDNPPMLLNCGHCVSKNALEKMQRVGSHSNQIKCPTCPNVQSVKDAQELFIF